MPTTWNPLILLGLGFLTGILITAAWFSIQVPPPSNDTLHVADIIIDAALPVVVTILVASIAYREHVTNRDKLRLDLFERRYDIYRKARLYRAKLVSVSVVEDEDAYQFMADMLPARFLFRSNVFDLFQRVYDRTLHHVAASSELNGLPRGADRTLLVREMRTIKNEIMAELKGLEELMVPYLRFED